MNRPVGDPTHDLDVILTAVRAEYLRAAQRFPRFNSSHEGYAVMLEEVEELWAAVRGNDRAGQNTEAIQVAAMAVRFLMDVNRG